MISLKIAHVLPIACFSLVLCEPQCSPFHYQEQLLEKMVDVKYKVDLFAEKLARWEKTMSNKMARLDEITDKQEAIEAGLQDNKFQTTLVQLQETFAGLDNMVSQTVSQADEKRRQLEGRLRYIMVAREADFNATISGLVNVVDEIKGKKPVLFKARSVQNQSPSVGSTVVFQNVIQNKGDGYNSGTGIFTAPASGTYLFTAQFCLHYRKELSFKIVVNESTTITAASYVDYDWNNICASTDGLAELAEGDQVKVVVTFTYPKGLGPKQLLIYGDNENRYWSYFSGVMVHA